jgi:hypothetical protein
MQTIKLIARADSDGLLSLKLPLGTPDTEYEILIVVQPTPVQGAGADDKGWPPGYFYETYGSIQDATFVRHPQGELPR